MHIPASIEVGTASPTDTKDRSKEILTLTISARPPAARHALPGAEAFYLAAHSPLA